jgi:nucleotide-binding universal stress UspA family protein
MFLRIVVPLDGSELAETALSQTTDLARTAEVSVHLVRVVDFGLLAKAAGYPVHDSSAELTAIQQSLEDEYNAAAAYLERVQDTLTERGLVVTTAVRRGRAVPEIVAATRPGDVVIMATHGRGGLGRWFLGSVAEGVARRSTVPVMLVPVAANGPGNSILDGQATGIGAHLRPSAASPGPSKAHPHI